MGRKANTRAAAGAGSIRQRADGTWEGRYVAGHDSGTGKQIRRSIYGKSQKEVRQKLMGIISAIDDGTYRQPQKMTVGEWLDIWVANYLGGVKPMTVLNYKQHVENHIKPALGAIRLEALNTHTIQKFYNGMGKPKDGKAGLSAKTVKNVHGVLHRALQQAVAINYIQFNPTDACTLPRVERKEIKPLDSDNIAEFLKVIQGHRFETLYLVMLFTGLRRGEVCGLTWDCVNLEHGTITVNKQLQNIPGKPGEYHLVSSKNGRSRTIAAASFVVDLLRRHRTQQSIDRLKAGPGWEDSGLVFTDEVGRRLSPSTVYHQFKKLAASIGLPDSRLHDLRHSYAVASIHAGDDIKTVQGNLGHATAAFTLNVYGHVTEQMKQASAARMDAYIKSVSGGKNGV